MNGMTTGSANFQKKRGNNENTEKGIDLQCFPKGFRSSASENQYTDEQQEDCSDDECYGNIESLESSEESSRLISQSNTSSDISDDSADFNISFNRSEFKICHARNEDDSLILNDNCPDCMSSEIVKNKVTEFSFGNWDSQDTKGSDEDTAGVHDNQTFKVDNSKYLSSFPTDAVIPQLNDRSCSKFSDINCSTSSEMAVDSIDTILQKCGEIKDDQCNNENLNTFIDQLTMKIPEPRLSVDEKIHFQIIENCKDFNVTLQSNSTCDGVGRKQTSQDINPHLIKSAYDPYLHNESHKQEEPLMKYNNSTISEYDFLANDNYKETFCDNENAPFHINQIQDINLNKNIAAENEDVKDKIDEKASCTDHCDVTLRNGVEDTHESVTESKIIHETNSRKNNIFSTEPNTSSDAAQQIKPEIDKSLPFITNHAENIYAVHYTVLSGHEAAIDSKRSIDQPAILYSNDSSATNENTIERKDNFKINKADNNDHEQNLDRTELQRHTPPKHQTQHKTLLQSRSSSHIHSQVSPVTLNQNTKHPKSSCHSTPDVSNTNHNVGRRKRGGRRNRRRQIRVANSMTNSGLVSVISSREI